jgi:hypothetical protein
MFPVVFVTFSVASFGIMIGAFFFWLFELNCCSTEENVEEPRDIDPIIPTPPKTNPIQIENPFYRKYQAFAYPNF